MTNRFLFLFATISLHEYYSYSRILKFNEYYSYSRIFVKIFMNILSNYWIYIKNMHVSHYGFVCPVSFSNEKYIRKRRKINIRQKRTKKYFRFSWIIPEYLPSVEYYSYSYSQVLEFTDFSDSYSYWLRESSPIPIHGEISCSRMTVSELSLFHLTTKPRAHFV